MVASRHAVAALAALTLLSCSDAPQGATQVKMHDNSFNAPVVRIPVGAGVGFRNLGRNPHNIVPADASKWPAGADTSAMAPDAWETIAFTEPGVYDYYCAYHGTKDGQGMAGTIVVGDVPYVSPKKGRIPAVAEASGVTRRVPQQYATIQGAVDAAAPGDLVLIDSGTYREEVTVSTPSLVIRGVERNTVVLDGEFLRPNGFNVLADAVALENLTARNHTFNGFFWNGVTGYRGAYLTAYNNGDYGIYAFDSKDGLLEDSYASGSPDAGFYIGQCDPCDAVIRRVIAEHNTLGYSGTNASGPLYIVGSVWRHNRGGIVPNSLDTELYPPQHGTVIYSNVIYDNNSRTAPGKGLGPLAQGIGVVLGGANDNVVAKNIIVDHTGAGVMVAPFLDANWWPSTGNVVTQNAFRNNGRADVAVGGPSSARNAVTIQSDEQYSTAPMWLTYVHPADGTRSPSDLGPPPHAGAYGPGGGVQNDLVPLFALAFRMLRLRGAEFPDWRTQPVPPPQPSMPNALTATARPAFAVFAGVRDEIATIRMPAVGDSVLRAADARRTPVAGTPRFGRAVAKVQAWVPLTPRLLLAAIVLIIAVRVRLWLRAPVNSDGSRAAVRVWRIASVVGLSVWVALALITAVSFSAI